MWVQGSGLGEPEGPPVIHLEVFVGGSHLQVRVTQFRRQAIWVKVPSWGLFEVEFPLPLKICHTWPSHSLPVF